MSVSVVTLIKLHWNTYSNDKVTITYRPSTGIMMHLTVHSNRTQTSEPFYFLRLNVCE